MASMTQPRELKDLVSIAPAMLRDLEMLGVRSVAQLARMEPEEMYQRLCTLSGQRQDPCVLDTFTAAVAQARDPELPPAQRQWWFWSRQRKREASRRGKARRAEA